MTIRFERDARLARPVLHASGLSDEERDGLEEELRRNYERLAGADGRTVTFRTPLRRYRPGRFRVRVCKSADGRCPTLVLEHRPDPAARSEAVPSWVAGLVAELRELVATRWLLEGERDEETEALVRAAEELSVIAEAEPGRLPLLLLAGQLASLSTGRTKPPQAPKCSESEPPTEDSLHSSIQP